MTEISTEESKAEKEKEFDLFFNSTWENQRQIASTLDEVIKESIKALFIEYVLK